MASRSILELFCAIYCRRVKFLNSHRAGHVYSKGHLRNISYISPLNFAVPSRNKKGEEYGDFWA